MIINKTTKGYQTNSLFADTDWTGTADFVAADSTQLAEKIKQLYPYYNFVLDKDGKLIDIVATERPPEPQSTPSQLREHAYETLTHKEDGTPLIEWEGQTITVNTAAAKWTYYSSEGSSIANELSTLIVAAKAYIREMYPQE